MQKSIKIFKNDNECTIKNYNLPLSLSTKLKIISIIFYLVNIVKFFYTLYNNKITNPFEFLVKIK